MQVRPLIESVGMMEGPRETAADIPLYQSKEISFQQLARIAEQIQSVTYDAERLVAGREKSDLMAHIEPDSWSIAECLDHLAQTTRAFLPAISNAVAAAPGLTVNRSLRTGFLARLFIRNLEPPYRLRFRVLPQLLPQQRDFESSWGSFVKSQNQLLETVYSAAGLAIDTVKVKSPVYARVSYNVYGALLMLAAHQRRHIWQIRKILTMLSGGSLSTSAS